MAAGRTFSQSLVLASLECGFWMFLVALCCFAVAWHCCYKMGFNLWIWEWRVVLPSPKTRKTGTLQSWNLLLDSACAHMHTHTLVCLKMGYPPTWPFNRENDDKPLDLGYTLFSEPTYTHKTCMQACRHVGTQHRHKRAHTPTPTPTRTHTHAHARTHVRKHKHTHTYHNSIQP